jgi:hypothetical protein
VDWFFNGILATGGVLESTAGAGGPWAAPSNSTALSLEVEGDPPVPVATIPEPSTLAVLLVALVGMVGYHAWQRRRAGLRLALIQCR